MKFLLISVIRFALRFIVPFILPFILPFAKDVDDKVNPKDQLIVPRKQLPKIFKWLETPDEKLPGGLYESTVADIYDKWGWFIASWYWLGWRNVAFGLAWSALGKPATNYMVHLSAEEQKAQGIYEKKTYFLGLVLITGYAVYRDWYNVYTPKEYITENGQQVLKPTFWAVQRISLRFADQD